MDELRPIQQFNIETPSFISNDVEEYIKLIKEQKKEGEKK